VPLDEVKVNEHLAGTGVYGAAPIAPGTSTTRIAILDFDSHKGEVEWPEMQQVVLRVLDAADKAGLRGVPWLSSGGMGVHLYFLWNEPQEARDVRAALTPVLEQCGFRNGAGGVIKQQVEVFPKQDHVAADGAGNMWVLPLAGQSRPLDAVTLEQIDIERVRWPMSEDVPRTEARAPVERAPVEAPGLELVQAALDAIPNADLDYDKYRDIIFAIHHASSGSDEGLALANAFSAKSAKHVDSFIEDKIWPYARVDREGGIKTAEHVFRLAARHGWVDPRIVDGFDDLTAADHSDTNRHKLVLFDLEDTRQGNVFDVEPPAPAFLVRGLLPIDAGVENGLGGVSKTTRHVWEAFHVVTETALYGRAIERPGCVLFVTAEDSRETFRYRLHRIGMDLGLSIDELRRAALQMHVLDLSGRGERAIRADRHGNLSRTDLGERLVESYRGEGVVLVEFDPLNLFGPGERYVNDGEAATIDWGRWISRELGACVRFTGHVSKVVGREGISDAHSGRGGSALGDNSRFVLNYLRHEPGHKARPPASAAVAAARGDLNRLDVAKLSAGPRPRAPIWIERQGFRFVHHEADVVTVEDALQADETAVCDFLSAELAKGNRHTRTALEVQRERLRMTRERLRAVIDGLLAARTIREADLPPGERQGRRQTYLAVSCTQELADVADLV
jgi:hypothetical protein